MQARVLVPHKHTHVFSWELGGHWNLELWYTRRHSTVWCVLCAKPKSRFAGFGAACVLFMYLGVFVCMCAVVVVVLCHVLCPRVVVVVAPCHVWRCQPWPAAMPCVLPALGRVL